MREAVAEFNDEALFCDGFDEAIVGVAERFGMPPVAAYDYDKYIELIVKGGCSREAAVEYFEFNVIGAWMGESTPVFVQLLSPSKTTTQKRKKQFLTT